jgi:glycosyltransferase involved in cell wall biosynthesis
MDDETQRSTIIIEETFMRIAEVAPLAESVPPKLYGGTERVVSWLTEALVDLDCNVTLFASGDSKTRARLIAVCPQALRLSKPPIDPALAMSALIDAVATRADEFDLIHWHTDWVHLPLTRYIKTPSLTTLHGRLDLPYMKPMIQGAGNSPFVSISNKQRYPLPQLNWAATIYHGLPQTLLSYRGGPGSYLAFLGRLSPEKGPDIAIRLAKAAKMPLRMAAKIPRGETRYFKETIKPLLDGSDVQFVGEVNDKQKNDFLGNASALLFPIEWPEPFGLVMIEAMACGTPVIAWRRGSVPELVEDGVTGFIVNSEAEALSAIAKLATLDRARVRAGFEDRFTARRMAQDYLTCFKALLSRHTQEPVGDSFRPPMAAE